mmetsp:Transcript_44126/g.32112  ORF Transcript_44126/g.32112 Transcript_44126/m.32112 type:complete len:320 (-) Transcript_44126:56-1015(-)
MSLNMIAVFLIFAVFASIALGYKTEDIFVPSDCDKVAGPGDHVLMEYRMYFANGSLATSVTKPSLLIHAHITSQDDLPVLQALKGMCLNSTRRIIWEDISTLNTLPIFLNAEAGVQSSNQMVYLDLTVEHITTAEEYEIFAAMRYGNYSQVLDLIENHVGVNAVDEWGQTPLMVAVQINRMDVIASLLNTRLPRVDVNVAKPSGYTALFYAIQKASASVVEALLRRGADPNAKLLHEGSRGNTPLHFACLLEKTKQAEMLLEFGAIPDARNEHGQVPLQLLPGDAVPSTKLFFKKMFEDALKKAFDAAAQNSLPPRFDL